MRATTSAAPPSSSTCTAPSSASSWNASGSRTSSPQSQQERRKRRTKPHGAPPGPSGDRACCSGHPEACPQSRGATFIECVSRVRRHFCSRNKLLAGRRCVAAHEGLPRSLEPPPPPHDPPQETKRSLDSSAEAGPGTGAGEWQRGTRPPPESCARLGASPPCDVTAPWTNQSTIIFTVPVPRLARSCLLLGDSAF